MMNNLSVIMILTTRILSADSLTILVAVGQAASWVALGRVPILQMPVTEPGRVAPRRRQKLRDVVASIALSVVAGDVASGKQVLTTKTDKMGTRDPGIMSPRRRKPPSAHSLALTTNGILGALEDAYLAEHLVSPQYTE